MKRLTIFLFPLDRRNFHTDLKDSKKVGDTVEQCCVLYREFNDSYIPLIIPSLFFFPLIGLRINFIPFLPLDKYGRVSIFIFILYEYP